MIPASTRDQAKALGDPTRHRIFQYLADSEQPAGVDELTAHLGLHHNAIRQHLAKLVDAGLVSQHTAPARGRGRPRLLFEVHPAAHERWGAGGPYQRLSLLLIEMLQTGDTPVEVGRRAAPTVEAGEPAVEALRRAMARGGFDPQLVAEGEDAEFVLNQCPFADTAVADPDTICGLHLGLAQGLAEQLQGVVVDDLEPRNPIHAGCRLRFHMTGGCP